VDRHFSAWSDCNHRVDELRIPERHSYRELPRDGWVFALSARRDGFSLIELVAVIALASLAVAAIVATLTRQQQFYRGATELRSARADIRDALEVLTSDIRGMSAADTPFRADSALELFAATGASVVCQLAGNEVGLPPLVSSGNALTTFLVDPDTGDVAMFYVDSAVPGSRWRQYRVASFERRSVSSVCPAVTGFSRDEVGASQAGFALTLAGGTPSAISAGTPVRIFRRGRYSLYRASDGSSYLGYRRCNAVDGFGCGTIQPVSGPYRSYSSDSRATGLLFEYFDSAGTRLDIAAPASALARIDVTARSESRQRNSFGQHRANIADSATVSVALRNRGSD
jgi:prepilin-type N-terminal cleavage/methylation domain-containing protein